MEDDKSKLNVTSNFFIEQLIDKYTTSSIIPPNNVNIILPICIAKGDSGATVHYWREADEECLKDIETCIGPAVILPNKQTILATKSGTLPLHHNLSNRAKKATILPGLKSTSLISLGQLFDDDCDVLLQKQKMFVVKDKHIIMQGTRNSNDGLWDIPIYKTKLQHNNYPAKTTHTAIY